LSEKSSENDGRLTLGLVGGKCHMDDIDEGGSESTLIRNVVSDCQPKAIKASDPFDYVNR